MKRRIGLTGLIIWTGSRCAAALVAAGLAAAFLAPRTALGQEAGALSSPAPKLESREAAHRAKLDAAMAPIMAIAPSADDSDRIRKAADAVKKSNMESFSALRDGMSDPVAKKLVTWMRLRSGYGDAAEYRDFLQDNPLWPERKMMTQRLEEALFTNGGSAASIKSYFAKSEPETGIGTAALASAHLAEGNTAEAKRLASKTWRELNIPGTLETGFLNRFGSLLTEADHKWRFDRMVTDDVRWAGNRAERAAVAKRVIPLLSADEQKKATARLAVFNKSSSGKALMAGAKDDGKDFGFQFHRAQLLRKAEKYEEAAKVILAIPPDPAKIAVLDEWWAERRQLAYQALKNGKPKLAYDLTKDAGPLTVNPLKEQTFMAGWIAWRYLKDEKSAESHFTALAKAADGPLSRAKAAYWLGRLAESRGDKAAAAEHYRNATRNPDTFHGLLAMQKLEPGRTSLDVAPPAYPTDEQIRNFVTSDAVKAAAMARKAGLSREYTRGFLTSLRVGLPSEAEAGMIAHLADMFGDTQMSVRVAKAAIARGQNLLTYGYPLHTFPSFKPLRKPPEMAFMLGITRQETEFEPQTLSGAGAKGLMQVMTVTAKHVCGDYKIKCDIGRLMSDTSYNATIASAYIADRMEEFDGSYVLGLAGYNAGPGRARQWIRENGDPRNPNVDPIDWIERIPITETREYVTKVLSNIQIYRARLGEDQKALRIGQDLVRAQGSHKIPASDSEEGDGAAQADKSEG
ncbi:MAG: transglycosylase SLT domain-containing protein [Hyphomicrobium sp.]